VNNAKWYSENELLSTDKVCTLSGDLEKFVCTYFDFCFMEGLKNFSYERKPQWIEIKVALFFNPLQPSVVT